MQTLSKLNNSSESSGRSADRRNAVKVKKGKGLLKSISSNMRPLRSRNVEAKAKEDSNGTTASGKAEKVPPTSFRSNLETTVVPKKTSKQTTCKRNSRRNNVTIEESSAGKENHTKKSKTAESGNKFPMAANSSTQLLRPAGRQMILRQNTNKNYRESSLVRSSPTPPTEHKVPIYLQNLQDKKTKKDRDPYEPDFASEDRLQKRRNLSEQHDETYHELLMRLEKKDEVKKKEEVKKKKAIATVTTSSYKKNIKNVMERVMKKVNEKKQKVAAIKSPMPPVNNTPQVSVEEIQSASYHPAGLINSLCNTSDVHISSPKLRSSNVSAQIISQISIHPDLSNTSQNQLVKSFSYPQVTQDSILLDFCNDSPNQVDKPIGCVQPVGFCGDSQNEIVKSASCPHVTYKSSPYRLTCFRPSPYHMYFKPNALPCLHQDLIMDYDFVMRFAKPPEPKSTKKLVQSSLLSYVEINGNKENAIKSYTLYDIEEFNISPKKNVGGSGRRVLGDRMEPNILVSTPKKTGSGDGKDIADLDISFIQREEGTTKDAIVVIEVETHRRIIETTGPPRQYSRSFLNNPTDDSTKEIGGELFDDVDPEFLENVDDQVPDLKGKKRRNRYISDDTTVEDGHRKRKKDEMTKEEKKQFKKWANEFNKMCAEVDKHQLHIV